jgi:hypothetical protein
MRQRERREMSEIPQAGPRHATGSIVTQQHAELLEPPLARVTAVASARTIGAIAPGDDRRSTTSSSHFHGARRVPDTMAFCRCRDESD